jgi:hypothetical protein
MKTIVVVVEVVAVLCVAVAMEVFVVVVAGVEMEVTEGIKFHVRCVVKLDILPFVVLNILMPATMGMRSM